MSTRSCLLVAVLLGGATAPAAGERFRVEFHGEVTSIDDGVPGSFSVGERVAGFVEFVSPPEWSAQTVVTFSLVDAGGGLVAAEWDSVYGGFPSETSYVVEELVRTGAIGVATESGFTVFDDDSELLLVRLENAGDSYAENGSPSVLVLGNRGRYAEHYPLGEPASKTLSTCCGAAAAGVQIYLSNFAFPPFDPDAADPEPAVLMLLEAANFPGVTRGSIEFDEASGLSTSPTSVDFDIQSFSVLRIPEPTAVGLLGLACVMLARSREPRTR